MIKIEQLDRMCTDKLLQATTGRWLLTRPRSIGQVDQVISYMTNLLNNKLLFAYRCRLGVEDNGSLGGVKQLED